MKNPLKYMFRLETLFEGGAQYRVRGIRSDGTTQINVLQSAFSAEQAIRRVKKTSALDDDTKAALRWEAKEDSDKLA